MLFSRYYMYLECTSGLRGACRVSWFAFDDSPCLSPDLLIVLQLISSISAGSRPLAAHHLATWRILEVPAKVDLATLLVQVTRGRIVTLFQLVPNLVDICFYVFV